MAIDSDNTDTVPRGAANPPGQTALAYRAATHGVFLQRMLDRLHAQSGFDATQPLAALTTRAADDPAIALLDAWAVAADVLTFYQERIANEGYLRTATERRSVLELARAVGYEMRPGVAAGTHLAFTVEDAPGAPAEVAVPQGTRVQSIPRPGQLPQTFETSADLLARAEWNALRPRQTEPQAIDHNTTALRLKGVATGLRPGDRLLVISVGSSWSLAMVKSAEPLTKDGVTLVNLDWIQLPGTTLVDPQVFVLRQRAGFFGNNAPLWASLQTGRLTPRGTPPFSLRRYTNGEVLRAFLAANTQPNAVGLNQQSMQQNLGTMYSDLELTEISGLNLETGMSIMLNLLNATSAMLPPSVYTKDWDADDGSLITADSQGKPNDTGTVFLDRSVLDLLPNSLVVLESGDVSLACRVLSVTQTSRVDYATSARVSRLTLAPLPDSTIALDTLRVRSTTAYLQSESLELAEQPIMEAIGGASIELDRLVGDLRPGQALAIAGETAPGSIASEIAIVDKTIDAAGHTTLNLRSGLQNSYARATVTLNANVVRATHGETVADEVLGSGDGGVANQRFALRRPPLTYVSAATASGAASTLVLRVDGVRWEEAPTLYGLAPRSRCYIVRRDAAGATFVIFGDGICGARLPSGHENVVASYRSGIGTAGEVDAGSLTLLQTRPLGIRGVTNPLPATGAAPPETRAAARINAPRSARTLDRIVSLRDLENFARAFAGIGKAQAGTTWGSAGRMIDLVVAGANGGQIDATSALYSNLVQAIKRAGLQQPFQIIPYQPRIFSVRAQLWIDPRYQAAAVVADATVALLDEFSFARRSFGQNVTASEVITCIQRVAGFAAVDLDALYESGMSDQPLRYVLPDSEHSLASNDLLTIDPHGITINWTYAAEPRDSHMTEGER